MLVTLATDLPNGSTNDITTPLAFQVVAGVTYTFIADLIFAQVHSASYDFTIVGQYGTATIGASNATIISVQGGGSAMVNPLQFSTGPFLMSPGTSTNRLTVKGAFTVLTSGTIAVSFSLANPDPAPIILKAGSTLNIPQIPTPPGPIVPVATPFLIVDDDTLQAIGNLWKATSGLPPLPSQTAPQAGRLKSPQKSPYAEVKCELDHRELFGVLGPWSDYRRVTITVYGAKADVSKVAGLVLGTFNRLMGAPSTVPGALPGLTYPSGATFMSWQQNGEVKLTEDPDVKEGQDVWRCEIEATVWSQRAL